MTRFAPAVLAALLAAAQAGAPRTIDRGTQSRIEERREQAVANTAEWRALWTEHAAQRELPDVDFARELVVAVFLGMRPTSGYGVEIVDAGSEPSGVPVVRYRETRPGPDMITAQVITAPFHIAAIERPAGGADLAKRVRFERVD